jgi:hypothetical protein
LDEIQIGHRAQELLNDDVLAGAFAALEIEYHREWRISKTPDERELAWYKTHALSEVQRKLRAAISNGQMAEAKLQAE